MSFKKTILTVAGLVTITLSFAQKFGYVDTEYILNQMPEYKAAKAEINKITADWQKEIEAKYVEINKLYETYQAEKILLTDDLRAKSKKKLKIKKKMLRACKNSTLGRME